MLTSKVQLGYVLTGGGGQAVQGGLSCPPPRISERMDNQQIGLYWLHCLTQILGGGQDKPAWTACPPPLGQG